MKRKLLLIPLLALLTIAGCKKDPQVIIPPEPPTLTPSIPDDGYALTVNTLFFSESGVSEIDVDVEQNCWVVKTSTPPGPDPADLATCHDPWFWIETLNKEAVDFNKYNKLTFKIKGFSRTSLLKRDTELHLAMFLTGYDGPFSWGANGFQVDVLQDNPDDWQSVTVDLTNDGKITPTDGFYSIRLRPGLDPGGEVWYLKDFQIIPGVTLQGPLEMTPSVTGGNAVTMSGSGGSSGWTMTAVSDSDPYFFFESSENIDFSRNRVLEFEVLSNATPLPLSISLGETTSTPTSTDWSIPIVGDNNWEAVICNISDLVAPTVGVKKLRIGLPANTAATFKVRNIKFRPFSSEDPTRSDPVALTPRMTSGGTQSITITDGTNPGEYILTPVTNAGDEIWFYLDSRSPMKIGDKHKALNFEIRKMNAGIELFAMWNGGFSNWAAYGREYPVARVSGEEWERVSLDLSTVEPDQPWTWIRVAFPPNKTRPTEAFEIRNFELGPLAPRPLPSVGLKIATSLEAQTIAGQKNQFGDGADSGYGADPEVVSEGVWKIDFHAGNEQYFFIVSDEPVAVKGKILAMDVRGMDAPLGVISFRWNETGAWDPGTISDESWQIPQNSSATEWKTVYLDFRHLGGPASGEWQYLKITNAPNFADKGRPTSMEITNVRMLEMFDGVVLTPGTNADLAAYSSPNADGLENDPEELTGGGWKVTWKTGMPGQLILLADGPVSSTSRLLAMQVKNASVATTRFALHWNDETWHGARYCFEEYGLPAAGAGWTSFSFDLTDYEPYIASGTTWQYMRWVASDTTQRSETFEVRDIVLTDALPVAKVE